MFSLGIKPLTSIWVQAQYVFLSFFLIFCSFCFVFIFFLQKHEKRISFPEFGMHSNQMLVKMYNYLLKRTIFLSDDYTTSIFIVYSWEDPTLACPSYLSEQNINFSSPTTGKAIWKSCNCHSFNSGVRKYQCCSQFL